MNTVDDSHFGILESNKMQGSNLMNNNFTFLNLFSTINRKQKFRKVHNEKK